MDNLIRLSSVTSAMRAKDILKKHGIYSKVQRIPAKRGQGSCSYGILLKNNIEKAVDILNDYNIKFLGRADAL
ncbi:MAG: DUF3343 domain-containing protein [Ruminococcus sp.]|nr:DUF3343 domain-containing protein [Ruminococcus sp.]